jgi:hypothetical protein
MKYFTHLLIHSFTLHRDPSVRFQLVPSSSLHNAVVQATGAYQALDQRGAQNEATNFPGGVAAGHALNFSAGLAGFSSSRPPITGSGGPGPELALLRDRLWKYSVDNSAGAFPRTRLLRCWRQPGPEKS